VGQRFIYFLNRVFLNFVIKNTAWIAKKHVKGSRTLNTKYPESGLTGRGLSEELFRAKRVTVKAKVKTLEIASRPL
jgi:hypothetical protein